ncbi:hypothetical protein Hanom_Chr00s000001g01598531 [Helianthus anomalus]
MQTVCSLRTTSANVYTKKWWTKYLRSVTKRVFDYLTLSLSLLSLSKIPPKT